MKRVSVTAAWIAAALLSFAPLSLHAQTAPAPAPPSAPAAPAAPEPPAPVTDPAFVRISRPVVSLGRDYTIPAGETVREVVVVSGSVTIEGRVQRDVVVVLGTARLASTAVIEGSLVSVAGATVIDPGARVNRDLVVVAGGFEAPGNFTPGGEHVVIGATRQVRAFLPWVTQGLLWGRLIVPSLAWMWVFVGVVFLVYLGIALLFERPVRACADVLGARPLSSFLTGLLVLLLTGPAAFILAVSVIGIAVIPFLICAIVIAGLVGKIGLLRWLGRGLVHEGEPDNRALGVRSFVIGFAALTLVYMVPVLGIVVWAIAGVFGLGAATLAFAAGFRRENPPKPRPVAPVPPPVPPPAPAPSPVPGASMSGYASPPDVQAPVASVVASPVAGVAMNPAAPVPPFDSSQVGSTPFAVPPPPSATLPPVAGNLATFPRAPFLDRLGAFALDFFLVVIVTSWFTGLLDFDGPFSPRLWLVLVAYHVGFWVWRSTTVGGIICNLRVIRTDGAPLQLPEALVRGFSAILSLAALGLGAFWILIDPERQAWHDRIAGTYVIKVPRNYQG